MKDNSVGATDEQVWRVWVHKGRVREQIRARRRRKVAGVVAVLASIAFAIFYLTARV